MLAHSFVQELVIWGLLHLLQIVAGITAWRELRRPWPIAAMVVAAVGSFPALGLLVLAVVGNVTPGVGVLLSGSVIDVLLLAIKWFGFPMGMAGVAMDPGLRKRPQSFLSRLAGVAATSYFLVVFP